MQAEDYSGEMSEMEGVSREEYLASLRRRSSGFSRGVSKYRGVARCQTKCRRHWQCFERDRAGRSTDEDAPVLDPELS